MKLTLTIDTQAIKRRLQCLIRHDWDRRQACIMNADVCSTLNPVIAWKVCRRCAKSKLIHILH